MKIASSSVGFEGAFERGELTQLEWLDICANELELDGVVFAADHFPRLDGEYLAQLKKSAVDLGLTVAAVAADDEFAAGGETWLDIATALGAPLIVMRAPPTSNEPAAWGQFTEALKARASEAKRANVTLALRDAPGTLCPGVADLARARKDVDSAWLRYALDARALDAEGAVSRALGKAVITLHTIGDVERFASDGDETAAALIRGLARYRGFVVLDAAPGTLAPRDAYHHAIERFAKLRAARMATSDVAH